MRLINFQHRQNKRMRKDKRGGIRQLLSILLIVSFCFSMMFTDMPDVEAAAVSESEMAETETAAEKGQCADRNSRDRGDGCADGAEGDGSRTADDAGNE